MHPMHMVGSFVLLGIGASLLSIFVTVDARHAPAPTAAEIECAAPQAGSHRLADAPLPRSAEADCSAGSHRAMAK